MEMLVGKSKFEPQYAPQLYDRIAEINTVGEVTKVYYGRILPCFIARPLNPKDGADQNYRETLRRITSIAKKIRGRIDRESFFWDSHPFHYDGGLLPEDCFGPINRDPITVVFEQLRQDRFKAIPILRFDASDKRTNVIQKIVVEDGFGCGIRINPKSIDKEDFVEKLSTVIEKLGISTRRIDIIVDYGYVTAPDKNGASKIRKVFDFAQWRCVILAGGSIPPFATRYRPGVSLQRRYELETWVITREHLGSKPGNFIFGDYGTRSPSYSLKAEKFQGTPKILYTTRIGTEIHKGRRTKSGSRQDEYRRLARGVVQSKSFKSPKTSNGDTKIELVSRAANAPAFPRYYIECDLSHHFITVSQQISDIISGREAAAE